MAIKSFSADFNAVIKATLKVVDDSYSSDITAEKSLGLNIFIYFALQDHSKH
jgi:hypothetical protein